MYPSSLPRAVARGAVPRIRLAAARRAFPRGSLAAVLCCTPAAAVDTVGAQSSAAPALSAVPRATATAADTLTLTLADVRRLAVTRNPAFLAARQDTAVAAGGLRQARLFRFNPDLQAQLPGAIAGVSDEPGTLTLTQEVEFAGQRGLRIAAARAGVTRAQAGVGNAARLAVTDAGVAFYRALAAGRRFTVAQSVLALNERLAAVVRIQLREGEIARLDANLAEIEVGRARGRVLAARREATTTLLDLTRVLGLAPTLAVRLVDEDAPPPSVVANGRNLGRPFNSVSLASGPASVSTSTIGARRDGGPGTPAAGMDADSLVARALAQRPDLAANTAAQQEAEAQIAVARREALPNVRFGVFVERRSEAAAAAGLGSRGPRVGPAVGLSLPLLNRGQGQVAQRRALATQARYEREATALRVASEVTSALRAYETATAEAEVFAAAVLEPARRNTALLDTAFRAGKIALPTLLLVRNQLLDAELGYWDAWRAQHEAFVQLQAATGAAGAVAAPNDPTAPNSPPRGPAAPNAAPPAPSSPSTPPSRSPR